LAGQAVRLLDMRGLYQELSGRSTPPEPAPRYLFGGLTLSFAAVEPNPMYLLPVPQPTLVRHLAERAHRLGAEIRWSHEVTDLKQDDGGVAVEVSGPAGTCRLDARFLVGADGGKSLVRKKAGIDFVGSTSDSVTRMAHVSLPGDVRAADGGLDVPGVGHLASGFNRLERGVFVFVEIEPGRPIVAVAETGKSRTPDEEPMTLAELREAARRVLGVDLPFGPPTGPGPHALRRIEGQNTRLADRYREGNVFLVGDAAHVHSGVGGPGLNLGLQDAVNLGWKLAAHVNGWAPPNLLDSYQAERRPVGERVMMHSLAQSALMLPGPEITGLRELFGELLLLPEVATRIARLMAGSDVRYDVGDAHPLSGLLVGDGVMKTELLHSARPVLFDGTGGAEFADAARPWADRVDVVTAAGTDALLVRPDGYVAWAADGADGTAVVRLRQALARWFGSAANFAAR
jgi:2-polyprenyl-6-methoxyphenol hydroxylase-like FAD-dependent oxidoreductase